MKDVKGQKAKFGADAFKDYKMTLPPLFPRIIGPNAKKYLEEVIDSGFLSDMTVRFEREFAKAHEVKHCIASPGCTPALHMLASAFEFAPGDEIIVSPITDYGTVLGLIYEDYIPVFADSEEGSINFSAETIKKCITPRTKAILVVHMAGIICDMDPINELAAESGLMVYEDACQSVFGKYKGRLAGTLGNAAGFSFDAEKTMGSDVGGCVITNDEELAERIRYIGQSRGGKQIAGYGRIHDELGLAYRMPLCTAAVTLAQLEIIRPAVEKIDKNARYLTKLLLEIDGIKPLSIPDYLDVFSCWMFGFNVDTTKFNCSAQEFAAQVAERGIGDASLSKYYLMPEALTFLQRNASAKVYPYSMPPASYEYTYGSDNCPNAKRFLETFIRWSSFNERYEKEHCEQVANIVYEVAQKNKK